MIGRFAQFSSPTGYQKEPQNFWREGWFPSRIVQFLEGATQLAARMSLEKQPVRGIQQALMHRLEIC